MASRLGNHAPAIILRGNGAVVTGGSLMQAVVLAWYLEDAARIELAVRQAAGNTSGELSAEEATQRATRRGGLAERMWDYLTHGNPEA